MSVCHLTASFAACVVSTVGFNLKVKAFIGIMRSRRKQFNIGSAVHEDAYTAKHSKRHNDAKKSIKMCIANVLAVRALFSHLCRFSA